MARYFTLGKNERLKSRKLIENLFHEGKSFYVQPFKIYYTVARNMPNDQNSIAGIRFGVGVSTKNFKKAVERNRIKRLTREGYRLQKNELQESVKRRSCAIHLFFIYIGRELPAFDLVKTKVNVALKNMLELTQD